MADIVNLNRARKKKRAAEEKVSADRNRVKFGRTKSEKEAAKAERQRSKRALDEHEREGK